jgi:excisionase family DNA binding protein
MLTEFITELEHRLNRIEAAVHTPTEKDEKPPARFDIDGLIKYFLPNTPRGTIYQWLHRRDIPARKIGRKIYFDRSEIEAWIAEKERPTLQQRVDALKAK